MNYYYDCEFLEGIQTKRFLGIPYGKTKPTIDMISIGIVCEDGREYYAISKDFNLKEAWNRYDLKDTEPDSLAHGKHKEYWIRENVLRPIWVDLEEIEEFSKPQEGPQTIWTSARGAKALMEAMIESSGIEMKYGRLKYLINKYGKSNAEIAEEVKDFISVGSIKEMDKDVPVPKYVNRVEVPSIVNGYPAVFYGYYSAYDHVVFCWLFGRMIDLPAGFPMYTRDLKQMLDEKAKYLHVSYHGQILEQQIEKDRPATLQEKIDWLKHVEKYPRQTNEHNALADARWNMELHKFINSI